MLWEHVQQLSKAGMQWYSASPGRLHAQSYQLQRPQQKGKNSLSFVLEWLFVIEWLFSSAALKCLEACGCGR